MTPWIIGDIVRLKSGGPRMTVTRAMADNYVQCQWFDRKQHPQAMHIPSRALKKA